MIVRNINDPEVLETTYPAYGGAVAQMILDYRILKEIGFLKEKDPCATHLFPFLRSGRPRMDPAGR